MKVCNSLMRLAVFAMVAMAGLSTAFAAPTWTPSWSPSDRYQVSSDLIGTIVNPSQVAETARQLEALGRTSKTEYYLVYTKQGDEVFQPRDVAGTQARQVMQRMIAEWQAQPSFPTKTYCVIVAVRGTKTLSTDVQCGDDHQIMGNNGAGLRPITAKATKLFLPNNVGGFAVSVATDINASVDTYHFNTFWVYILLGLVAFVACLFGYLFVAGRKKGEAAAQIAAWEAFQLEFTSLSEAITNMPFGLTTVAGRATHLADLQGEDKVRYETALAGLSEAAALNAKFTEVLAAAKKAHAAGGLGGNKLAINLVSVTAVVLKDGNPPETILPTQLPAAVKKKLLDVKAQFQKFADAMRSSQDNLNAIDASFKEIEAEHPKLEAAGLPFSAYQPRLDALVRRRNAVQGEFAHKPVTAAEESQVIKADAEQLKSDLLAAIQLKSNLASTSQAIAAAKAHAADVRSRQVSFDYPFVDGEKHPDKTGQTFILTETGGDPDGALKNADAAFKDANDTLLAGELAKAKDAKNLAETAAAQAVAIVDNVLASKAYVEQHVLPERKNLASLNSELTLGKDALHTLKDEFLASNFAGQDEHVSAAGTTSDTTESSLAAVREAYHQQNFVAAHQALSNIGAGIQSARDGLAQVHVRLKQLQDLRAHAKQAASDAVIAYNTVAQKSQANAFTTSSKTDAELSTAQRTVDAVSADSKKKVTDWTVAAKNADAALAELHRIDGVIDSQKTTFETAKNRIDDFTAALRAAKPTIDGQYTRDAAQRKFAEAESMRNSLVQRLAVQKSDWDALLADVNLKIDSVKTAVQLAEQDHREGSAAASAIGQASQYIDGISRKSYGKAARVGNGSREFGGNYRVDLGSASSTLNSAVALMRDGRYRDAQAAAESALNDAQAADQLAAAAVAAMIAEAESEWERANPPVQSGGGDFGGNSGFGNSRDDNSNQGSSRDSDNSVSLSDSSRDSDNEVNL